MSSPSETTDAASTTATTSAAANTGADPGVWEWTVVGISVVVVAIAIYLAVRYLLWPGERETSHIKREILRDEPP